MRSREVIWAAVFCYVAFIASGCQKSDIASKTPPAMPLDASSLANRIHLSEEQDQKMGELLDALYHRLDAQLNESKSVGWDPPHEIMRTLEVSAANGKIDRSGCTKDFCRFQVALQSEADLQYFTREANVEGTIFFRYDPETPLHLKVYIVRPGVDANRL